MASIPRIRCREPLASVLWPPVIDGVQTAPCLAMSQVAAVLLFMLKEEN